MARPAKKAALTERPRHLLPDSERRDPFKEQREEYLDRRKDPEHPAGHIETDEELAVLLDELKELEDNRREDLFAVAAFMNTMLGIEDIKPSDFDVVLGEVSGDSKRVTMVHAKESRAAILRPFNPAMRAFDLINLEPASKQWLAVFGRTDTTKRADGSVEHSKKAYFIPLDIRGAIAAGEVDADFEYKGVTYMTPTRESYERLRTLPRPNVAFFENTHAGPDQTRRYMGRHSFSGKRVFAAFVPSEFINKPGVKKDDLIHIGCEATEGMAYYQATVNPDQTSNPTSVTDEEWAARELELKNAIYALDKRLERRMERYHIRRTCFVFDVRTLAGLSVTDAVTGEAIAKAKKRGKLSRGGEAHVKEVVLGEAILVKFACQRPVEDPKAYLAEHGQKLFDTAVERLEEMFARAEAKEKAKTDAHKTEPPRGDRDTSASSASPEDADAGNGDGTASESADAETPADAEPAGDTTPPDSEPAAATESTPPDES